MRAALAFLTCLGGPVSPTPRALSWFPLVGAALGLALGAGWWGADQLWPPLLAATLVVGLDLALTGMLHLDGLADSADGLLAHGLDPGRRLEVMAEPTAGAFALATVAVVIVLRVAALTALAPSVVLLAALWATSRSAMAAAVLALPYARCHGLASSFREPTASSGRGGAARLAVAMITVLAVAGVAAWLGEGGSGVGDLLAGVAAAVLGAAAVLALARRRLGGYTGDVLGAAGMVAETAGLVVVAARW